MAPDVTNLIGQFLMPEDVVLIELPAGKQHSRGGERASGLPVWSLAAGYIWAVAMSCGVPVVPVSNTEWTRDYMEKRKPGGGGDAKTLRRMTASFKAPAIYTPENWRKDTGGDLADAICLIDWWLARQNMAKLAQIKGAGSTLTGGEPFAAQ